MTDLKLIDELLCDLKQAAHCSWPDMEVYTSVTREAMHRLRTAYESDEMKVLTLGLAKHFAKTKADKG